MEPIEVRDFLAKVIDLRVCVVCVYLGGGNSNIVFMFTPNFGELIQFDEYFSKGLKPPTSYVVCFIITVFIYLEPQVLTSIFEGSTYQNKAFLFGAKEWSYGFQYIQNYCKY